MKQIFIALFSFIAIQGIGSDAYKYKIDLTSVANDQVQVELLVPEITTETVVFGFPKTVPGTYAILDYGRFIENFEVLDKQGKPMLFEKTDTNHWQIHQAKNIAKIRYKVNDSFDALGQENPIFEPAGTNIEAGENYVLNLQGFIGYFVNMLSQPFEIEILHAEKDFGSTSLTDLDASKIVDKFVVQNYHEAVDNPIMYCKPETAFLKVGNTEVMVSIYSPSKKAMAAVVAKSIDTLLQAQGRYLGGKLPVDKYSFIIYLTPKMTGITGGVGALEHSYSSLYFLSDMKSEELADALKEIAAHEFFHIVTPLNIHAEQIGKFDYDEPKMSEHLWLYEGTTEYHAQTVQVKYGLMPEKAYMAVLKQKMDMADRYLDTLPFTEMSKNCLVKYKSQYENVYEKGAMIGLCLDLKLLKLSDGKFGLVDLIQGLAKSYGKNISFKDDELVDKIVSLSYPELRTFFEKHIYGKEPLPYKELLANAGINYIDKQTVKGFSLGGISMNYNPETKSIGVVSVKDENSFGKLMGYKVGDQILKMNGKKYAPMEFFGFLRKWKMEVKEGDKLTIQVARLIDNKVKKVKLTAQVFKDDLIKKHVLENIENASAEQQKIKDAWLKPRN